jgi:hypothetical protein
MIKALEKGHLSKLSTGINLSKDPNSTKGLQSPKINIQGLDKIKGFNKDLEILIKNLLTLKDLGKKIDIDFKDLKNVSLLCLSLLRP